MLSLFLLAIVPGAFALNAETLLIAAASDLATVERPLATAFRARTGHDLNFVLQSSGNLARQIANGAPYDVYLSANEMYVKELAASGDLAADSVRVYATGRLGLWSAKGDVRNLEQLLDPEILHVAIANPAYAPYGVAAREALRSQGLWEKLEPKIVYAENVRQSLQYAESRNADAVITSWTLVYDKGGIELPADWHNPIRQAGAVIARTDKAPIARQFLDFLTSPEGQTILSAHGLHAVE